MKDFSNSKILVTGSSGMLGNQTVKHLKENGVKEIILPSHSDYDLTKEEAVINLFETNPKIDLVIHIAGDVGGIGYSKKSPGQQFYNNILMNTFVQHYSYFYGVKKFIGIGSVCEYPEETSVPFIEDKVWSGYPVPTNDGYGLSKRAMLAQSLVYRKQYEFNAVHLLLVNLYGPNDNFDSHDSHVIPALIKKFRNAKKNSSQEVEVWGSGEASREFLFVEDAARAIILAAQRYNSSEPINIGSGNEIKISELARMISDIFSFRGNIKFAESRPEGQKRRCLDVSRALQEFDFESKVGLRDGLSRTVDWYLQNY